MRCPTASISDISDITPTSGSVRASITMRTASVCVAIFISFCVRVPFTRFL